MLFRRLRRRRSRGLILMYHRVSNLAGDPVGDPWQLCVSQEHFAEHMDVLARHFSPYALPEYSRLLRDGKTDARAVVVTFDDGYADNLHAAAPPLAAADVPATVFVTTGYIDAGREFWWDELARSVLVPETLPEQMTLAHGGSTQEWNLSPATLSAPVAEGGAEDAIAPKQAPPGSRLAFYHDLWSWLQPLSMEARHSLLDQIRRWSGQADLVRETHRPLTTPELQTMVRTGVMQVGAHTVSHAKLTEHPAAEQRRQMVDSRDQLEEWVDQSVTTLSYPFAEFDRTTVRLAGEAGFTVACAGGDRPVSPRDDALELPRLQIRDCSGEELLRTLRRLSR